jgi:ABC-2 type transport system permease protein
MKKAWIIARRDFRSYFASPIAYLIIAFFLAVVGWMFFNGLAYYIRENAMYNANQVGARGATITDGIVRPLYGNMNVIFLLLLPLLTMRVFSEEKKQHTIELLLTSPVKLSHLVIGKFLSSALFVGVMLACTLVYPIILAIAGNPDYGPIFTSMLGTFLLACWYLSLGGMFSAMTENQIVAAALTFLTGLFFWLIPWASQAAGPIWGEVLNYLSPINHFNNFTRGLLDTADVAYYLSATGVNLFITHRILDSYRWR